MTISLVVRGRQRDWDNILGTMEDGTKYNYRGTSNHCDCTQQDILYNEWDQEKKEILKEYLFEMVLLLKVFALCLTTLGIKL